MRRKLLQMTVMNKIISRSFNKKFFLWNIDDEKNERLVKYKNYHMHEAIAGFY